MATAAEIRVKKQKGHRAEVVSEAILDEGFGLRGDIFGGRDDRQVSLFDYESRLLYGESRKDGFCISRFDANILIKGFEFKELYVGTKLIIGEAVLQVTHAGKECHDECPVYSREGKCGLYDNVAFAKVIKGGIIKTGDSIIIHEKKV